MQNDTEPLSERDRAIVECLRILARRGRALREAKEKEAAEQANSLAENNLEPVANALCPKEKDVDDISLKGTLTPCDKQSQVNIVSDEYDT